MPAPQEPRSPRPETEYTWQGDWARPTPPPEQPPSPAPTDRQRRQAARRRREMRRRRRRAAFLGTAAGILALSGIITLILPKSVKGETEPEAPAVTGTTQLVAPLPYAGPYRLSTGAQSARSSKAPIPATPTPPHRKNLCSWASLAA